MGFDADEVAGIEVSEEFALRRLRREGCFCFEKVASKRLPHGGCFVEASRGGCIERVASRRLLEKVASKETISKGAILNDPASKEAASKETKP